MTVARAGITVLRPSLPYNICDCYITVTVISSRCTLGEVRQYTTARPPGNTTFVCFQHSNRKLFCVVRAHHQLQHFNDLAQGWLSNRGTYQDMMINVTFNQTADMLRFWCDGKR
jgi:hypothetical protein